MISETILIPKIYARLQEIASKFFKIFWGRPQTRRRFGARFGASPPSPLTGPPLRKIPGSAPVIY